MITTPAHALVFGTLDLLGVDKTGAYWFETLGEDAEMGNPVPVERIMTSFLQDGAIAEIERDDNREMAFTVIICAPDSAGLAAGELALMAQTRKRNILTWTPPDDSGDFAGVPCVFDVVTSHLDFKFDDIGELRLERTWRLNIKALPGARAESLVTVLSEAPSSLTATITSVDACTALTNWTRFGTGGAGAGPLTVEGGTAVKTSGPNTFTTPFSRTCGLLRSSLSVDTSVAKYLRLLLPMNGYGGVAFTQVVKIDGTPVPEAARNGDYAWYLSPVATVTTLSVERTAMVPGGRYISITIADVSRSDLPGDLVGARQTFRSLQVAGSARAQGSLELADPTVGLGTVLVYSTPGTMAQQPPLRALRVSGSTETTDTSLVSGKYSDLATTHVFDVPAPNVTVGGYVLMARVKHASAGSYSLTWSGKSRMGSTTLDVTPQTGTQLATVAAGAWTVVEVAKLVLPTRTLGSAGMVRIELTGPSGLLLDEAWLFNYDTGNLTWVECGTGTGAAGGPANRLWIDAASLDNPVPSVWIGHEADRTDAYGAGASLRSFGAHEFVPPMMNVFTVTTDSVDTDVTLSSYPTFHTHVVA